MFCSNDFLKPVWPTGGQALSVALKVTGHMVTWSIQMTLEDCFLTGITLSAVTLIAGYAINTSTFILA